jgi:UDPglucose 6-dehydrogenase
MKITIIGTGYVGLVTGACFAEIGHDVMCLDNNKRKINNLKKGILPIYENNLERVVIFNLKEKRLNFTTSIKDSMKFSNIVFIAVDTPQKKNGEADLTSIKNVCIDIAKYIEPGTILVQKSTVPVGTSEYIKGIINKNLSKSRKSIPFSIVSNPEFLKEGTAVDDFMKPDRIIIGLNDDSLKDLFKSIYLPLDRKFNKIQFMDVKSAELTKYASNAMLATKISFINELANIADCLGVDIENVRKGMGADKRIGYEFLYPGCGYGGSCFPKDISALIYSAEKKSYKPNLLKAVDKLNNDQKSVLSQKISKYFKNKLNNKTVAVWGLAFKPNTDDVRFAASMVTINYLLSKGATVKAYDPIASLKSLVDKKYKKYSEVKSAQSAINRVDALIICTEWKEFWSIDPSLFIKKMSKAVIFDGRNIYDPKVMRDSNIDYFAIGRGMKQK